MRRSNEFFASKKKIFVLAAFFSGHLFAQDASSALEKDKENVLSQAIGVAQSIYSDSQKNALSAVAMTRNCFKAFPNLKEKIKGNFLPETNGFDQKTRDEINEQSRTESTG